METTAVAVLIPSPMRSILLLIQGYSGKANSAAANSTAI